MTEEQTQEISNLTNLKETMEGSTLPDKPSKTTVLNFIISFINTIGTTIGASIVIPEFVEVIDEETESSLPDMPDMPGTT